MSRLPAEPALVGREHEIQQLMQYLNSAVNGKGSTVFISGEAGVGKTRLANEFLTLAKKKGVGIFAGWCLSEANIPYFPFREAFNGYISATRDGKTKSIALKQLQTTGWYEDSEFAQELGKHEPYLTPQIERDRTFEAAARVLLQLSAQEPLILFLDDLHWADSLSLALLHYLSRECRNFRLLIIGTYRLEELAHAEDGEPHPLEETMFSMSREDLLTKMELTRLERNDLPEFLRSIFGSSLDEEFEERLFEETEGNPLFAIETLNMLVDEGCLQEKHGQWTLVAPIEKIGIPSKVHEVITRRVVRLDREKRKLLDLAAICGSSFTPDILSKASKADIADVLHALIELEQKHRLIRSIDSEFEFTHHKIREVVYGSLPTELRRVYHLKIARCLEEVLTKQVTDGYMADMVIHSVEGGVAEKAFEYLLNLGERAVNILANEQAIDYLTKALETAQKIPSLATSENLAKIYKNRGIALLNQDEKTKARSDFDFMLKNAINIKDESTIAEAHYWLGCAYEPYFGEMEEATRYLTTAVEMARKTGNRPLEARSLNAIGSSLVWGLDTVDEGRMRLEESAKICKEVGDKITEADDHQMLGVYYNWKGEFNQAKESLAKALALAEEVRSIPVSMHKLWSLSYALAGNGEYNEAIKTGQRCLQLARDHGDWSLVSMVLNTLGWMYHDLSNIELASKYNNDALETTRVHQRSRASGAVPMSLLNLGTDYLYKNDYEKAEEYFKEVVNQYQQHRVGWWRVETRILLGRGEIALAKGDCQQALRFAEESLAISQKAGARKHEANGLKLKAEVLAKMGNTEEAIKLAENALNLAQQMGNPTQLWQIHYSLGFLEEKHGDAQKANEHYAKAIALIEAVAAQLNDAVLKGTLLASQKTRVVRDAFDRTKSVQERSVGLERLDHGYLQATLSALDEVTIGEAFDVRLDITNAAAEPALLVRVEIPIPSTLKIDEISPKYEFKDSTINLESKCLEPKKIESIKIRATAFESGIIRMNPRIVYVDGIGKFNTCKPDPITVTAYPLGKFQFKTSYAESVFEFLTKAFMEDYMRRRLPLEKSGWRTLMQIVNNTKASRSSLYGHGSRRGPAISELERRGVVEIRIFLEERGRGGKITKTRLAYEKDIVKRYVDQQVVKIKKKQQEHSEP